MNMKCTLINPVGLVHAPYGLMYIASVLELCGCNVEIKELPSRHIANYRYFIKKLIRHLKKENPDLVGITCMASQRYEVSSIIRAIKESGLSSKVVVGGVHASFMPEDVMAWGADYAVLNEGEDTIRELVEAIRNNTSCAKIKGICYRTGVEIIKTEKRPPVENIDMLPQPAYHLIDRRHLTKRKGEVRGRWLKSGWIFTSRGCPSACTFCSAHRMFGVKVRYRSMDKIFEEISFLVKEFGIEALVIMDDTFTVNKKRVLEFCERIKAEHPGLLWNCQARVNFFDEEMGRAMKRSGCLQVDFGVESGSQAVLDRLKKGIKIESTIMAFDACKKSGLRSLATVMVGNPDEGFEDLELTRKLLERIKPDFSAAYIATPFPGTELYEEAIGKGLIDDPDRDWHQLAKPISMSNLDSGTITKAIREFTKMNAMKNYVSNLVFLIDMLRFSVMNPGIAMKVGFNLLRGRADRALFFITNSVYFK